MLCWRDSHRDGRGRQGGRLMASATTISWSFFFFLAFVIGVCKSGPIPQEEETSPSAAPASSRMKQPGITYAAGPNQLTMIIGDKGAVRFGYETDNQFRAERRFPNGTVAGYYGYIGADGVPVRVKYGAVEDLGFQAMQENIPVTFAPTASPDNSSTSTTTPTPPATNSTRADEIDDRMRMMEYESSAESEGFLPGQTVNEAKNSISVNSADDVMIQPRRKFVFPKIELEEFAHIHAARKFRSLPEAVPISAPATVPPPPRQPPPTVPVNSARARSLPDPGAQHSLVLEQEPGEPAIIYSSDPIITPLSNKRSSMIKTLRVQFGVMPS